LRVVNNHNKEISNTTDNLIVLDDSNNETQEFGGDSTSSTSGEGERSDADDSGSEKSKEREENEKDEEMTRDEIEVFIDQMKSDPRYKLVEYRAWRLYEPTQRDVKLFDKMNLYDFAVNQEANILISALGQIVQIKRRKKGFNWAILSLGYIEISGRNRLSAILRKEETTDVIAVPICDLIPDSRKIQISAQQREELLAQYQSSLTQPKAKSSPRVRKRTQTNYFTPNSPNKRLKSLINSPQLSTPKSTPKTIPKTSPKLRDAVVTDDSSQCESGYSPFLGFTSNHGASTSIPFEIDAPNSNSSASYQLLNKKKLGDINALELDSNSNLAKTVKKSEELVPVSSGSTRHFGEGNALDLAVSVQPGISNFPPIQQSLNSYGLPSGSLHHGETYLFNNQQQFHQIQQFQLQQQIQQQQHLQQQEYFKQQQLRQIQLQNQCETQFDLQRQSQRQFETLQQFQFQIFQQQQQQQQQTLLNELMLSKR
jgi:hypothetical protein